MKIFELNNSSPEDIDDLLDKIFHSPDQQVPDEPDDESGSNTALVKKFLKIEQEYSENQLRDLQDKLRSIRALLNLLNNK